MLESALKEKISWRDNGLNTIKMLAALSVMFLHAVEHLDVSVNILVKYIFGFFPGVPTFFVLSGFLIWNSVGKSSNVLQYAKKRFWRIFPQLWSAKIIGVIVILFTFKELSSYKDLAIYGITSGVLLLPGTPDFLNEYGSGTPNGSLWTIYVTIQFYIVVYFMYKLLHGKKLRFWVMLLVASIAMGFVSNRVQQMLPGAISSLYNLLIFEYFWMFAIGAFVAENRDTIIPFLKKYWFIFIGVAMVFFFNSKIDIKLGNYNLIFCTLEILGLIGFAYRCPKINIKFDFSYGIYLYHMIVVNAMIELGFTGKIRYIIIAILISAAVSLVSEKTIGKLPITKKNKIKQ
jgi:peptidoglycan/LPS O-acetylase OafA/YrhL